MKLKQLSLFLENQPGHLEKACRVLACGGVNVETMALADTEQYGILRFLVRDWKNGLKILASAGMAANVTDVVAVAVPDQPGGLADLLAVLTESGVNIEYMYGFPSRRAALSVIVLRLDNPDRGIEKILASGLRVLTAEELFPNENPNENSSENPS